MKLSRTLILLWLASLTLFAAAGFATLARPEAFNGVSGWALRFFLGYCGIIIVAQVLAAMDTIRQLLAGDPAQKPLSWRQLLG
jgi:hypothetical protein